MLMTTIEYEHKFQFDDRSAKTQLKMYGDQLNEIFTAENSFKIKMKNFDDFFIKIISDFLLTSKKTYDGQWPKLPSIKVTRSPVKIYLYLTVNEETHVPISIDFCFKGIKSEKGFGFIFSDYKRNNAPSEEEQELEPKSKFRC